jgi:hypothetical protein
MQLQCATKGRDTVGQPPNAENDASHLLSLQAQKSRESNAVTAAVVCGNRMTNSIGEVFEILRKTVPLTSFFLSYMEPLPLVSRGKTGKADSRKRDYRHRARTGCDDNRLSTGGGNENAGL